MIDPTKISPEKLAEMNDSLIVDNNYLRAELNKWRDAFGHLSTAEECANERDQLEDQIESLREIIKDLTNKSVTP